MGYTHYWRSSRLPKERFKLFVADCEKVCKALEGQKTDTAGGYCAGDMVHLVFEYNQPDEPPVFGPDSVHFNGAGDLGHETFVFARDPESFEFCKTARKPYDVAVTACLIAAKHHFGNDVQVSSDGDEDDWNAAREWCQKVLGYGADFKLGEED